MGELVEWLREQLDEDERTAQAASAGPWSTRWNGQEHELVAPARTYPIAEWTYAIATQEPEASAQRAECDTANADHIAAHDPARVLREIDAKRQVLDEVLKYEAKIDGEWGCCHDADEIAAGQCPETQPTDIPALRLLALPYADRPGYHEEWRP